MRSNPLHKNTSYYYSGDEETTEYEDSNILLHKLLYTFSSSSPLHSTNSTVSFHLPKAFILLDTCTGYIMMKY